MKSAKDSTFRFGGSMQASTEAIVLKLLSEIRGGGSSGGCADDSFSCDALLLDNLMRWRSKLLLRVWRCGLEKFEQFR